MTTPCPHDEWTAHLTRNRHTDDAGTVTGWSMELQATCVACAAPRLWHGGEARQNEEWELFVESGFRWSDTADGRPLVSPDHTTIGLPYFTQILGKAPSIALLKAQFVQAALTVPDVASAQCFISQFTDRVVAGQVQVTSESTGQTSAASFAVKSSRSIRR